MPGSTLQNMEIGPSELQMLKYMNAKILIQGKNLKAVQIILQIFMKQESLINKEIIKDTSLANCMLIITLTLMCMKD